MYSVRLVRMIVQAKFRDSEVFMPAYMPIVLGRSSSKKIIIINSGGLPQTYLEVLALNFKTFCNNTQI